VADTNQGPSVGVQIPEALYRKIEMLAQEAEFPSVESYIVFVLEEVAGDDANIFTPDEEEKVKERLRNLGYL